MRRLLFVAVTQGPKNMKGVRTMRTLMFCLIISTCAMIGVAAEEEVRSPFFLGIIEEDIIPEHMETYMKTKVANAKLDAEYKYELPYLTFVQDFRVTTVVIFKNFAKIDDLLQKWEAWNEKTGGKANQLGEQIAPCVSQKSIWINVSRPDMSYSPKEPTFRPDYSKPYYLSVTIYRIKPGKYKEAEAFGMKTKALNERKQFRGSYFVEECFIGQDMPAFIVGNVAKDKAAFINEQKELQKNPDPEFEKLSAEIVPALAKVERSEGTFVPDASYVPEGTFD